MCITRREDRKENTSHILPYLSRPGLDILSSSHVQITHPNHCNRNFPASSHVFGKLLFFVFFLPFPFFLRLTCEVPNFLMNYVSHRAMHARKKYFLSFPMRCAPFLPPPITHPHKVGISTTDDSMGIDFVCNTGKWKTKGKERLGPG